LLYADTINEGDNTITLQELPEEYHNLLATHSLACEGEKSLGQVDLEMQKLISTALARCKGNVSEAARWLGVSRATLYRKLSKNTEKLP
jgi:transcriptional regulator of acetoin/glycerol metabolism